MFTAEKELFILLFLYWSSFTKSTYNLKSYHHVFLYVISNLLLDVLIHMVYIQEAPWFMAMDNHFDDDYFSFINVFF